MWRHFRAVPIAVLLAVVIAAASTRLTRRARREVDRAPPSQPLDTPSDATVMTSAFERPLSGPSPPPALEAGITVGGARAVHGGPQHRHRAGARGPRAVRVAFRANAGGPIAAQVTTSPDERTLYVATLAGDLVALSRDDGAKRWSVALGERMYGAPFVHDDGTIFVGSDAKKLFAVTPKGEVAFRLELDGEVDTSPALAKDGTVILAAGNQVYAIRRSGDVAWRWAAKGKVFTSPAVTDDGLVIVGSQDDHVHAIGPGGALVWSTDLGADVDGAAAIGDDGGIFVGTDRGDVVRLDAKGTIAWRTPVGGFVRGVLSIARNGDVLAGTYGPIPRVVRIAPDGSVRGAFAIRGTGAREFGIHGGPLEDADGALFFGAQDDAVYALEPTGVLRFRFDTGGDVDAPLTMLSDGALVVPSEDGNVSLLLP